MNHHEHMFELTMPLFPLVIEKGNRRENDQHSILPRAKEFFLGAGPCMLKRLAILMGEHLHYWRYQAVIIQLIWVVSDSLHDYLKTTVVADISQSNVDYLL